MTEDEVYQPRLWYYSEMLFLVNSTEVTTTEGSIRKTAETGENQPTRSTTNSRKKHKTSHHDKFMTLASNNFKTPDADADIIAKSWVIKLNRLVPDQRRFAEKIINDVLFEGEMGNLTRDGVIFKSATSNTQEN
ncbi:unnamed protein product [Parnassius apollo]|uniref:(apollo) hypothetical protein n=1 Tax=Parnassius apollo TaxID=110799 RepID=A0A8S3WXM7_PARAO|nr:unnamed protein product [Parnassius apollo]